MLPDKSRASGLMMEQENAECHSQDAKNSFFHSLSNSIANKFIYIWLDGTSER
jgi:hypothetical protein